jgi:hypothetical protein
VASMIAAIDQHFANAGGAHLAEVIFCGLVVKAVSGGWVRALPAPASRLPSSWHSDTVNMTLSFCEHASNHFKDRCLVKIDHFLNRIRPLIRSQFEFARPDV